MFPKFPFFEKFLQFFAISLQKDGDLVWSQKQMNRAARWNFFQGKSEAGNMLSNMLEKTMIWG